MVTFFYFIPVLFFVLLTGCSLSRDNLKIVTDEGAYLFKIEKVTTEEGKRQGLMGREFLSEDSGMLFVYSEPERQSFWMKNMLIPLDIIFISPDFKINYIYQKVYPCKIANNLCPRYSSFEPSQYVLEIYAGLSEKLGIEVGDEVVFQ